MKTIEVGHKIMFGVPKGREYNCPPVEGVVYKIDRHQHKMGAQNASYTIFVKHHNSLNLSIISTGFLEYDGLTEYRGKVGSQELLEIQAIMKCMEAPPVSVKTPKVKAPVKIREDAVLDPNKDYFGHYIEGYIKTKKVWAQIIRTTAKMAFFEGGKCSINNVEKVRQMN